MSLFVVTYVQNRTGKKISDADGKSFVKSVFPEDYLGAGADCNSDAEWCEKACREF